VGGGRGFISLLLISCFVRTFYHQLGSLCSHLYRNQSYLFTRIRTSQKLHQLSPPVSPLADPFPPSLPPLSSTLPRRAMSNLPGSPLANSFHRRRDSSKPTSIRSSSSFDKDGVEITTVGGLGGDQDGAVPLELVSYLPLQNL